ncbi:Oidioi.mRNA.OKI2018_I69.PAR.g11337.t1.cds [Oikopleura dioica]|uniref:Oidioi.mRNA.OKI2018_I69.PAR.g11337.t1.cds n=1 Tax=Oikopleura dioica TaxID=34765 RepID=A0ABN7RV46_OIKDI|nr:Oidioi.mRNA.OKI2018_I69.PAR.g11337.t1.cds [Oikopleura dioica]
MMLKLTGAIKSRFLDVIKIMEKNSILGSFLSVDHVNKQGKKSSIRRRMSLKGIKKIFKKKTGPPKVEIRRAFRRRSSMRSIEFWEESIIA